MKQENPRALDMVFGVQKVRARVEASSARLFANGCKSVSRVGASTDDNTFAKSSKIRARFRISWSYHAVQRVWLRTDGKRSC